MLLEIFIFLQIISIIALITATILKDNIPLFLLSFVMFGLLAYAGLNIQYTECENQIGYFNVTADNITALTNNVNCHTENVYDSSVSWLNLGFAILSLVLMIIAILINFKSKPTGQL